jgi:hypothetical protein
MSNLLCPGQDMESQHILLLSTRLAGPALEFWGSKISGKVDDWNLIDVVQALEAQFLPLTLYETAKEKFDNFRQCSNEKVLPAYWRLKDLNDALLYEASLHVLGNSIILQEIPSHLAILIIPSISSSLTLHPTLPSVQS